MWGINSTGSMMGFYSPTPHSFGFGVNSTNLMFFLIVLCVVGEAGGATATSAGGVVIGIVA